MPVWEKGALLRELTAETVEALVRVAGPDADCPLTMVELRLMGGALGRQPEVPNAVSGREGAYSLLALGVLAPGFEDVVPLTGLAVADAVRPWTASTTVLNWLGATATRDEVAAAWAPEVHERLVAVKRRVDPHDVFRVGHAVAP